MEEINKELLEKLNNCKSEDDAISLMKDNGFNITKEDISKYVNKELSDDDLENVTGGFGLLNYFVNYISKQARDKVLDSFNNLNEKD